MSPFSESGSTPPENTREDREGERTEAGAWLDWAEKLREQGATSLLVEVDSATGEITIQHERGDTGVHGLGYDMGPNADGEPSNRIWMKLTGEAEGTNANAWNANDRLEGDVPGVTFGEDGRIAADHPIAVLLRGYEDAGIDGVEGHFVGNHNGWRPDVESMFKQVDDDNGEFVGYQVNLPEGEEGKVIIVLPGDGRRMEWKDNGNADGEGQELSITPSESA